MSLSVFGPADTAARAQALVDLIDPNDTNPDAPFGLTPDQWTQLKGELTTWTNQAGELAVRPNMVGMIRDVEDSYKGKRPVNPVFNLAAV